MSILELNGLTRKFAALTAVNNLTLSIERGQMIALLGPNGAGKSTTIKMLTTLLPPTGGTARVDGLDIVQRSGAVRRIIGYVPQLLSADGTLTGAENLMVFARLYDLPRCQRRERVEEALRFMGLSESADKLVRRYSGGMIRRLEIAQSMLHNPRILFLDEPTVGLDPAARRAVWDHIGDLRSRTRRDDRAHHAPHGRGGRAVRLGGDHAPGKPRGAGHAGRAEIRHRRPRRFAGRCFHPLHREQSRNRRHIS